MNKNVLVTAGKEIKNPPTAAARKVLCTRNIPVMRAAETARNSTDIIPLTSGRE